MIDRSFIEENFPTLSSMVYLNTASTGIPPRRTIEVMREQIESRTRPGRSLDDTIDFFRGLRQTLARLLGGREENYAPTASTSHGLNAAAHALEYEPGSNIVICDLEFPANYVPWQNVCRWYDVELRVVKSRNGRASAEDFAQVIDERTRVVAVSLVQFSSGYKIDIRELARAAHDVDAMLVADIIQAAGWADIDLPALKVDFAAAQAAKWLVGPIGAGFVYVSRQALEVVRPRYLGWWGVKDTKNFSYFEREPLEDARRFHVGSLSPVSQGGLLSSLETLLEIPNGTRERAAMKVADYLRERLSDIGVEYYDFGARNNSPIVSCRPDDVEDVAARLTKKNIHCSVRNGRLRVSPHFYNTAEDIDHLVEVLR